MALIRDALRVTHLPLLINPRHSLAYRVTDLIVGWGHCGTNRRRTLLDAYLLFDAPLPMSFLVVSCILEVGRIW
jgi:hypothetical protein